MSVGIQGAEGRAGGFAMDRFVARRRVWRHRFWWAFLLVLVVPIAVELPIAMATHPSHPAFWIGFGLGAGLAAAMVLFDSPPGHIEKWRIGSDGEKATARQLRPLLKPGWTLFNDIETSHGNIDHVLVGPAGIFMLESKRLSGIVTVDPGKLVVRWHEDPEHGYENESIGGRARAAAYNLHSALRTAGAGIWVQAIVVLWADLEQRSTEQDKILWVRGDQLATVLAEQPARYPSERVEQLASATRSVLKGLGPDAQDPTEAHPQLSGC